MAAVLFDMDGTLIDSSAPIRLAISRTLEEFGYGGLGPKDVKYFIGTSLSQALLHWTPDPAPMVKRYQEIYIRDFAGGCRAFPGIVEMLDAMHGKLDLGIITLNANHEAREVLRRVGLDRYFGHVFGDDAQRSPYKIKPHPQHYFYALCKMGIIDDAIYASLKDVDDLRGAKVPFDAPKVVFIGDTKSDIIGSKRAGITAVGATWRGDGGSIATMLSDAGADAIMSAPAGFVNYLRKNGFI